MTTSLSRNGYALYRKNLTDDEIEKIKKELTVSPRVNNSFQIVKPPEYILYRENSTKLYLPRNYGLSNYGLPERDVISDNVIHCSERLVFQGTLRKEQEEPVNAFFKCANDPLKRGGIISVPCGGGKTVMALYCICALKVKTLFIAHKDFLLTQFIERAALFIPTAKIGIIKQNKVITEDCDIVIGSLQSIAMRDYDPKIFSEFGLVIIDECHHTSAEVFSNALVKVTSPIMMGLSATLNRKDGLRRVFEWFLGKPVMPVKKASAPKATMDVKVYKFRCNDPEYNTVLSMYNGRINMTGMLTNICSYRPRTHFIVGIILDILKDTNRKVLVLGERRSLLKDIENILRSNDNTLTIGYYVGGMTRTQLKNSEDARVILATYQMASEGMDIASLNTLVMASPIGDIEQSIGRIQRQKADEQTITPLTIDIYDTFSIFNNRFKTRSKFYKSKGFNVVDPENSNTSYDNNDHQEECDSEDGEDRKKQVKHVFVDDDEIL